MARIFVDKYGNETTEGPQEGVIGSATGTHSSAGLNSFQTNFGAVSRGDLDAPQGVRPGAAGMLAAGMQQPGGPPGPGVAGAIAGQPGVTDPNTQVAGRWFRNENGQWMQGTGQGQPPPNPGNPYAGQFQDRPLTVQQLRDRAMHSLPALGAAQPQAQNPQSDWQRYLMNQVWGKPLGS